MTTVQNCVYREGFTVVGREGSMTYWYRLAANSHMKNFFCNGGAYFHAQMSQVGNMLLCMLHLVRKRCIFVALWVRTGSSSHDYGQYYGLLVDSC